HRARRDRRRSGVSHALRRRRDGLCHAPLQEDAVKRQGLEATKGRKAGTKTDPTKDTRERLVEAATRMFAERGYRHVTIRAISQAARANVAAVNYHFSD